MLPAIPFGVTRYAAAFRGAISISADTLTALIAERVPIAGRRRVSPRRDREPPLRARARRGAARRRPAPGVSLFDLTRRAQASRLTDEFRRGSCHAGSYETSLVLSERPELIDAAAAADLPALEVNMPAAIADGRTDFLAMGMERAYCGAPAEATAAEGEQTYGVLVELLIELIRELV